MKFLVLTAAAILIAVLSSTALTEGTGQLNTRGSSRPHFRLLTITSGPENVASEAGEQTIFNCTTDAYQYLNWRFIPAIPGPEVTLVDSCALNPAYTARFRVEILGYGRCSLIAVNPTVNDAGLYTCSAGFDQTKAGQFVVLDPPPSCSVENAAVVENDTLFMSCNVFYTNKNLSPMIFGWTDELGRDVTPAFDNGTTTRIAVSAVLPAVRGHTFKTYFDTPINIPPDRATNTPSYTYQWTSPDVYINYCPKTIEIIVPSDLMKVGDTITCEADGFPEPSYFWTDLNNPDNTKNGANLTFGRAGEYNPMCTATTVIQGVPCSLSTAKEINILVTQFPNNTAALAGDRVTLNCRYGTSTNMDWLFVSATDNQGAIVARGCSVVPGLQTQFEVDKTEGACNLVVISATSSHAGRYSCQETTSGNLPAAAELIILDNVPSCTTGAASQGNTVDEGTFLELSCNVNLTGHLKPAISWTTYETSENITNGTTITTEWNVRSFIQIPAYHPVVPVFHSRTFFLSPPPPQPPIINEPATNPPEYEFIWLSPFIQVFYCPLFVVITPDDVYIGDTLTCSCDSAPPATYIWTNEVTGDKTEGPTVLVPSAGEYSLTCTATSQLHGGPCSRSTSINFKAINQVPLNTLTYFGMRTTLYCSVKPEDTNWLMVGVGTIAAGCRVLAIHRDAYDVEIARGGCNLIILSASGDEAGTYVCEDFESVGLSESAELLVMGYDPHCHMSRHDDVIINDEMKYECSLPYWGAWPPRFEWTTTGSVPLNPQNTTVASLIVSYVVYTAQVPALPMLTFRMTIPGPPAKPPVGDPAQNPIDYEYIWQSDVAPVTDKEKLLIHRNRDPRIAAFDLTWEQLKVKQGDYLTGSFYWYGLEGIRNMTQNPNYKLRIDLELKNYTWYRVEYQTFRLADENNKYELSIGGYSGNYPDAFGLHNGMKFTTKDNDNDGWTNGNCAIGNFGGWWHDGGNQPPPPGFNSRSCFFACLTTTPDMIWYYNNTLGVMEANMTLISKT